ncbi:50S ribosomal protein L11 methyltransferase [Comamonas serinivorans]|uniref:Ribosomal protein L11 methyltransferase n=1 Tax=Comamonas serinivorans TaxID=1082851 RepID=A0A1Y0ERI5_9BURK|nr:50S ribosomal protein L11 methyltransferase [Comamonas serinivorans]ARU05929.1 50S ribosomal protein L11 methyltransferase [Comamonas serinivorans]
MHELRLRCALANVDTVCEALEALDALSVSVEDANALTADETPLFGEPGMPPPQPGWEASLIVALFASRAQADEAAQLIQLQPFFADGEVAGVVPLAEQDWVRLTQSQFEPVEITPEFWIVPTWHEPPAQAVKLIRLDPGLAFGTGTHPTTRMCLRWIARQAPQQPEALARVLDYGCGSGILAIGAGKWGAARIDAVDIDPDAVTQTERNALANGVQLQAGLPDQAQGEYDTVLANILAQPLKVLAPLLVSHVRPGGHLVLAGVLERQVDELQQAYAPWVSLSVADREDGWVLLHAHKPA